MGKANGVTGRECNREKVIMISNERPSHHGGGGGYRAYSAGPPKPPVNEDTLKTEKIQVERKTFIFTLKENPRGRFLRITEDVNGRRDNVIIPSTGLEEFRKVLEDMVKASAELPVKAP
jgi:hypothetical protein